MVGARGVIHFLEKHGVTIYAWNLSTNRNTKGDFLMLWKGLDITKNKAIRNLYIICDSMITIRMIVKSQSTKDFHVASDIRVVDVP